jgi:DHA1 family inner membrane transport protein
MPVALWALTICVFAVGTAEYVISGILPQLSRGLGVSSVTAGQLVTVYAVTIVVAGPLLTAASSRWRRRPLMLGLLTLFLCGTVLSAAAPSFGFLVGARIVSALSHATFFAVCTVAAVQLVPPERAGSAIAIVASGLTLATVLGVPLGTLVGQSYGWRVTFWAVAGFAALGILALAVLVPNGQVAPGTSRRAELAALRRPGVQLALCMTVFGYAGVFTAYTYIVPLLEEVTHFRPGAVTILLLAFGVGALAGNFLAGQLADRHLMASLVGILAALMVVLLALGLAIGDQIATAILLFLLGFTAFATVPGLQTRIIGQAGGAPTLAAATNIAAFQLANALGAGLGGLVVGSSLGLRGLMFVAIGPTAIGLAITVYALVHDRRAAAGTPGPAHVEGPAGRSPDDPAARRPRRRLPSCPPYAGGDCHGAKPG